MKDSCKLCYWKYLSKTLKKDKDLISRQVVVEMLEKIKESELEKVPDDRIGDGSIDTIEIIVKQIKSMPSVGSMVRRKENEKSKI